MEYHHLLWVKQRTKGAFFNSYVKLPEGKSSEIQWFENLIFIEFPDENIVMTCHDLGYPFKTDRCERIMEMICSLLRGF